MDGDLENLKKAMEGFGTDEDTLIKIIANRTTSQRLKIKEEWKKKYGTDLIEELKKELHGKFEEAIVALFSDPIDYDCDSLRSAMSGLGTNEDTLIEIISSRPQEVLKQIKERYQQKFNRDLIEDIKKDTHGTLQNVLTNLLQCKRSTNKSPNSKEISKYAQEIYDAGEAKIGHDSSIFNKYLTTLSPIELICLNQEYNFIAKHTILDAIDKEFVGNSKKAFRALVYATLLPSEYFATRVNEAVKGIGTKDHLLMRVLITRDEIDMPQIKECYKKLYGKSMIEAIKDDISGNYRKLMLELCHH
jgi:hypothetical protein